MPPVSKAQARFMRAVAGGYIKKKGLSRHKAEEFVSGFDTKNLPEHSTSRASDIADHMAKRRKRGR